MLLFANLLRLEWLLLLFVKPIITIDIDLTTKMVNRPKWNNMAESASSSSSKSATMIDANNKLFCHSSQWHENNLQIFALDNCIYFRTTPPEDAFKIKNRQKTIKWNQFCIDQQASSPPYSAVLKQILNYPTFSGIVAKIPITDISTIDLQNLHQTRWFFIISRQNILIDNLIIWPDKRTNDKDYDQDYEQDYDKDYEQDYDDNLVQPDSLIEQAIIHEYFSNFSAMIFADNRQTIQSIAYENDRKHLHVITSSGPNWVFDLKHRKWYKSYLRLPTPSDANYDQSPATNTTNSIGITTQTTKDIKILNIIYIAQTLYIMTTKSISEKFGNEKTINVVKDTNVDENNTKPNVNEDTKRNNNNNSNVTLIYAVITSKIHSKYNGTEEDKIEMSLHNERYGGHSVKQFLNCYNDSPLTVNMSSAPIIPSQATGVNDNNNNDNNNNNNNNNEKIQHNLPERAKSANLNSSNDSIATTVIIVFSVLFLALIIGVVVMRFQTHRGKKKIIIDQEFQNDQSSGQCSGISTLGDNPFFAFCLKNKKNKNKSDKISKIKVKNKSESESESESEIPESTDRMITSSEKELSTPTTSASTSSTSASSSLETTASIATKRKKVRSKSKKHKKRKKTKSKKKKKIFTDDRGSDRSGSSIFSIFSQTSPSSRNYHSRLSLFNTNSINTSIRYGASMYPLQQDNNKNHLDHDHNPNINNKNNKNNRNDNYVHSNRSPPHAQTSPPELEHYSVVNGRQFSLGYHCPGAPPGFKTSWQVGGKIAPTSKAKEDYAEAEDEDEEANDHATMSIDL